MHRRELRALACAAVGWLALAGGLRGGEKEDGFVPLFNGKDLAGWVVKGKAEGWQIKDGVLRSEGGKGGEWLRSAKEYGDFILKVDWKVSKGGNSGVFLRVPDKDAPWQHGYEVQISNAPRDEKHCTGALYGCAAVKPRPDETADKWHALELHCVGPRVKVIADGVTVVDVDQTKLPTAEDKGFSDPKTKALRGYVGLQDSHAAAGSYVEFRNVRIKELKPAKAAPGSSKLGLTPATFPALHALVRPHANEWRHLRVNWLTDVVAARRRAAAEDKPIVICYTGGAGYNEPLGVC